MVLEESEVKQGLIETYARAFVDARKNGTVYPVRQWKAIAAAHQERPALRALAALFRAEGMTTDAETIERQLNRYPEVTE